MYNYDYKKNKLPSNPYSQLLVHNVASTFSGKRCDRYRVRIFFPGLELDSEATVVIGMLIRSCAIKERQRADCWGGFTALALDPCGLWSVDVVVVLCCHVFASLFQVSCDSQFWLWTPTKLVNWIRFFFFNGCVD